MRQFISSFYFDYIFTFWIVPLFYFLSLRFISNYRKFSLILSSESLRTQMGLEGFRGLLAFYVFLSHVVRYNNFDINNQWAPLFPHHVGIEGTSGGGVGWTGVTLFFMLTGFLFWEKYQNVSIDINYFKNRIRRLAPCYYFVTSASILTLIFFTTTSVTVFYLCNLFLILCVFFVYKKMLNSLCSISKVIIIVMVTALLLHIGKGGGYLKIIVENFDKTDLKQFIGLFSFGFLNYFDSAALNKWVSSVFGMSWTLRYEWIFYLTLPIFLAVRKKNFVACVLMFFGLMFFTDNSVFKPALFFPLFIGAMCAEFKNFIKDKENVRNNIIKIGSPISMVIFILLPFYRGIASGETFNFFIIFYILIFVPICLGANWYGILSSKTLQFGGLISYSVYLSHGLIFYLLLSLSKFVGYPIGDIAEPL